MRALVSASDAVAVARAHADRIHDLARRLGCNADEATEVVEASAIELLDDVLYRPHLVTDLVGRWFSDARRLAERCRSSRVLGEDIAPEDATAQAVREASRGAEIDRALDSLGERARAALLLRDSYDLEVPTVAIALSLDEETAAAVIAEARLALIAALGEESPVIGAHAADLASLGRWSDGGAEPTSAQRKHLSGCAICAAILDAQTRARAHLAGVSVLGLAEQERSRVLQRVSSRAGVVLLSSEQVQKAQAEEEEAGPLISPLLIALALALAVLAGLFVGASSAKQSPTPVGSEDLLPKTTPSVTASLKPSPSPSPSPTPSPTPIATTRPRETPSASPAPTVVEPMSMTITPASGPNNTPITVTGVGWTPHSQVTVSYLTLTGRVGSQATGVVSAKGRFTLHIRAHETLLNAPGPHTVRATSTDATMDRTFTATN